MSGQDVDDYNQEVEAHNREVDECSGSDSDPYKKGCGIIFAKAMNLIIMVAIAFAGLAWLQRTVTAPITGSPDSVWTPVVNPVSVPGGGYVPAMYVADFPSGDRCYALMGILGDQVSCVPGVK